MAQKDPKKKMPLTRANAIMRSAKLALVGSHHLRAQLALRCTHGIMSMAQRRCIFFQGVLDVCVNQEQLGFALDVLNCDLEAMETSGFGYCYLSSKVFAEVFVDNSIGSGKECKNVRDEVLVIVM